MEMAHWWIRLNIENKDKVWYYVLRDKDVCSLPFVPRGLHQFQVKKVRKRGIFLLRLPV
jgi:hypothetical protein